MEIAVEIKMDILDAIANEDLVYQNQLRQLTKIEKQFDKMIGALTASKRTQKVMDHHL